MQHVHGSWCLQRCSEEAHLAHLMAGVLDRHADGASSPKERSKHLVGTMSIIVAAAVLGVEMTLAGVRSLGETQMIWQTPSRY